MMLEPCDIYFTRGSGRTSKAIRYFSGGDVSHVGLIAHGGSLDTAVCVEALFSGVVRHRLWSQYFLKEVDIEIWRPKNITDANREIIVGAAVSRVGEAYGYFDVAMQLFDSIIPGDPYLFRRLGSIGKWSVCSCHVITAFNYGGLSFGLAPNEGQPDDMRRFCQNNPDKYRCVAKLQPFDKEVLEGCT